MSAADNTDIYLLKTYAKLGHDICKGTILEVGAGGPDVWSNSALFFKMGWKILPVEPNPYFQEKWDASGRLVYKYAASNKNEDNVTFFRWRHNNESSGLTYEAGSSLGRREDHASGHWDAEGNEEIRVNVRTLNWILETHEPNIAQGLESIDMLLVDVEGWEPNVIEGFDFAKYRPKLVMLENNYAHTALRDQMQSYGYILHDRHAVDDIFVPKGTAEEWAYKDGGITASAPWGGVKWNTPSGELR